jgi:hypothetical protein
MSIKGNAGNVDIVKDLLLFTGIAKATVLAINPTLKELQDLGIGFENEIVYNDKNQEELDRARIDIWLECFGTYKSLEDSKPTEMKIRQKVTFFLTNRPKANQDNSKTCYINSFGQTCWGVGTDKPTEKWFRHNGERVCIDGEDSLTNFLRAWVNAGKDNEVSIDDSSAFFKADYSELSNLLDPKLGYNEDILKVMLIVVKSKKDGKYYQNIHNKFFARHNNTSIVPWNNEFKKDKRNLPNGSWSFPLQVFQPGDDLGADEMPEEEVSETVKTGSSKWT